MLGARRQTDVDWDLVCAIASRRAIACSAAAPSLRLLGLDGVAKRNFPGLTGRAPTPLDRSKGFAMSLASDT